MNKRLAAVALRQPHRPDVSGGGDGRHAQGRLRARFRSAGGRPADARRAGAGCGRPPARHAAEHRSRSAASSISGGYHEWTRNRLLRHTLATLAYRGGKALRGAPPEFAEFRVGAPTSHAGRKFWRTWAICSIGRSRWRMASRALARFAAARLGRRERRASSPRSKPSTGGWLPAEPPACSGRKAVPGPDCRRADARRPDRHAAPSGRLPLPRRELLRGRHRGGARGA